MAKIKGVMLLPLHAQSYCRHMANHTFLAKVNSGAKTPDPRLELTQLVEGRIRQELNLLLTPTHLRVLRWEEIDQRNRLVVRFRELDGVFETANGITVLLEVKASASKGSLKTGLEQLQSSLKTATHARPNTIGLLVVADLGEWYDMFGQAASQPLAEFFSGMEMDLLDWPPCLPAGKMSGICVSLIPGLLLGEWLTSESEGDFE